MPRNTTPLKKGKKLKTVEGGDGVQTRENTPEKRKSENSKREHIMR